MPATPRARPATRSRRSGAGSPRAPASSTRSSPEGWRASATWIGPGYFDALRIPILHGRALDERDRAATPRVAVVSESMARDCFGAADSRQAVGRRFRLERETGADAWIEVVGVARDIRADLTDPQPQVFYRSFAQWGVMPTALVAPVSSGSCSASCAR